MKGCGGWTKLDEAGTIARREPGQGMLAVHPLEPFKARGAAGKPGEELVLRGLAEARGGFPGG